MARRVTRAQLRKLRTALRDGRRLAIIAQPQLLAAYRGMPQSGREQLSQMDVSVEGTSKGFEVRLVKTVTVEKKKVKRRVPGKKRPVTRTVVKTKYSPTQILGRRASPGDQAMEIKKELDKRKPVTVNDIAAQKPVAPKIQPLPRPNAITLRSMSNSLLQAVVELMR